MPTPEFLDKEPKAEARRSLILAGGGVRLAYQAGVLQALKEHALSFAHVDGTSGGIFNTAMLASGLSTEAMCDRWRKIKIKNFMSLRPARNYLRMASMMAFGDADGIRQKVFPELGIDLEKIRTNPEIDATFNVCNFTNKTIEAVPQHQVTEDHLIAGVSLPIFMPAIKIQDDWYSDAVWIKDANLMEAVRRGAEEIWLVWAIGNTKDYLPGFFNQYVHMIEMSANGGLLEEYAQIRALNERIQAGDSPYGQRRPIRLHVIRPEYPLPLDPDLFFDKIDTGSLINWGYDDARRYLKQLQPEGIALDANSTRMQEVAHQLSFRQRFTGKISVNGQLQEVAFHPYFSWRDQEDVSSLNVVSGIYLESLGKEVSTYENRVKLMKSGKSSYLKMNALFTHAGAEYGLETSLQLYAPLEWMLGLEFKRLEISISKEGRVIGEGVLVQGNWQRLRHWLSNSFKNFSGGRVGVKKKYTMLSKLYTYEV
jgi:predicted acylesterase/phospholipase RssA